MDELRDTKLLDYGSREIQRLLTARQWSRLSARDRIGSIHDFVRDEILFGYNRDDALPSSQVLRDGYGQCNTKAILLMSLLRATGIRCRFHGFLIDKALQRGAISGLWYWLSPRFIVHSWVEVELAGVWYNLEGFILDLGYLASLQRRFPNREGFCGYGAATTDLQRPQVYWNLNDTYIQREGITHDLGVYSDPDTFFEDHGQRLGRVKTWVFQSIARHEFNRNVERIRGS